MASTSQPKAVPAQLGFLAIYNPSLGTTDETLENQIVYYSSPGTRERSRQRQTQDAAQAKQALREENNEQLRQIGLAQGMVEFGRSFSDGQSVDTVETEKSRIILHELESGWWVLASIDLTILPTTTKTTSAQGKIVEKDTVEHSSREVKPAILLLGDILRAHSTFLLHHSSSMSALFVRTKRSKFIGILGRYWDTFLSTWNVLMHGNPACNLYGGIKLAACGELGIGVGEEERGSGEREVLEGFVGRIDGLVDVMVSKFGDAPPPFDTSKRKVSEPKTIAPWLGSGNDPATEDGAVFLGTGALSRKSIRDLSHWIEDLYRWGPHAYGVVDNPSSTRRAKASKQTRSTRKSALSPDTVKKSRQVYGLNPNNKSRSFSKTRSTSVSTNASEVPEDTVSTAPQAKHTRPSFRRGPSSHASTDSESHKSSKFVQYLKLGYGTHWSIGASAPASTNVPTDAPKELANNGADEAKHAAVSPNLAKEWEGQYLIGLSGNLEDEAAESAEDGPQNFDKDDDLERILLRTLTVELERAEDARAETDISIDLGNSNSKSAHSGSERTATSKSSFESQDRNKTKKLRVVVYINRPFIFVFLFELRTEVLSMASLYRSLHLQIAPLVKPLTVSTTFRVSKPDILTTEDQSIPIFDLVWDPKLLTVSSSIANIPDPYQIQHDPQVSPLWSRTEALNTHMQIISTYIATSNDKGQLERTCKTSRGWWVVWTRIPEPEVDSIAPPSPRGKSPGFIIEDSSESSASPAPRFQSPRGTSTFENSTISGPAHPYLEPPTGNIVPKDKEIFLIRRASDHVAAKYSGRFPSSSGTSEGWAAGPGRLAHGIGVDTKRYINALLNL